MLPWFYVPIGKRVNEKDDDSFDRGAKEFELAATVQRESSSKKPKKKNKKSIIRLRGPATFGHLILTSHSLRNYKCAVATNHSVVCVQNANKSRRFLGQSNKLFDCVH